MMMADTRGLINYLRADIGELVAKDPSVELDTDEFLESHDLKIENGRDKPGDVFGRNGFELLPHDISNSVGDLSQEEKFGPYRKDVARFVETLLRARSQYYSKQGEEPLIFVGIPFIRDEGFDEIRRDLSGRNEDGESDGVDLRRHVNSNRAHHVCHNDYTESFIQFIQMFGGVGVGETHPMKDVNVRRVFLKNFLNVPKRWDNDLGRIETVIRNPERVVVLNMWRSLLETPLEHCPLAVCAADSIDPTRDLVPRALESYGGQPLKSLPQPFEIFLSKHNPDHRWSYFPQMTKDEVLVFKTFDSRENPFRPPLHSAFLDPNTPETAEKRKSCEIRTIVIWPSSSCSKSHL